MSNKPTTPVPVSASTQIKLGGRSVEMRYNFEAAAELDKLGINLYDPATYANMSPNILLNMVWAGQLHLEHKALSLSAVAKEMTLDADEYVAIAKAVSNAIRTALK